MIFSGGSEGLRLHEGRDKHCRTEEADEIDWSWGVAKKDSQMWRLTSHLWPTKVGVSNCIWADHFAIGAVAKWDLLLLTDYLWYLSISTFYQGARHHLLDLPRRGRRHGVLEGDEIISIFAEEASTCYQVGESDQRFVVLKRSGSHYTLLCTQVIFFQKPDSDYYHFRRTQSLAWRSFVRPSTSSSGGLRLTRRRRALLQRCSQSTTPASQKKGTFTCRWHI